MNIKDFDGFYFLPNNNESHDMRISYFNLTDESMKGNPVDTHSLGDMYHVAFFKMSENGLPEFDAEFEAIFADPEFYIRKNIVGSKLYGCILRKTENSYKWWNDYLKTSKEKCAKFAENLTVTE
jgi:hypothetical protein